MSINGSSRVPQGGAPVLLGSAKLLRPCASRAGAVASLGEPVVLGWCGACPWVPQGRAARIAAGCLLVALAPVRDLLLRAKHLFVAAMEAGSGGPACLPGGGLSNLNQVVNINWRLRRHVGTAQR